MAATIARRGALIALGLLAALLSAEALLQIGAAYRAWSGRRPELALGSGTRILCVGDSHTYGLYLDADESYPAQLQGLLGAGVQVVNLGFPGMNSSRLRVELPGMLDAIHPSIVFILIGANDLWTAPVPVDESSQRAEGWSSPFGLSAAQRHDRHAGPRARRAGPRSQHTVPGAVRRTRLPAAVLRRRSPDRARLWRGRADDRAVAAATAVAPGAVM